MENAEEEGKKSEPGEIPAKGWTVEEGREENIKEGETEQRGSVGSGSAVMQTWRKEGGAQTSTCVDFTGIEVKERRNQGIERSKLSRNRDLKKRIHVRNKRNGDVSKKKKRK